MEETEMREEEPKPLTPGGGGAALRRRVWEVVEVARPGDRLSRVFDTVILTLIFLNVVAVVLESVEAVQLSYGTLLWYFEACSIAVFSVEYAARLWACAERPGHRGALAGRLRFALRPMSLVDLLAILPFYLQAIGVDLRFLRALRLMRIFRLAKLARYSASLRMFLRVVRGKKEELVLTMVMMVLLLVIASTLMYYCEHEAQPEQFPSIPGSMWWTIVTLTTVGYGDTFPITVGGKLLASLIAIFGIGMFALPTGILGAAFVDEIGRRREREETAGDVGGGGGDGDGAAPAPRRCPHCGEPLDGGEGGG